MRPRKHYIFGRIYKIHIRKLINVLKDKTIFMSYCGHLRERRNMYHTIISADEHSSIKILLFDKGERFLIMLHVYLRQAVWVNALLCLGLK